MTHMVIYLTINSHQIFNIFPEEVTDKIINSLQNKLDNEIQLIQAMGNTILFIN